MKKRTQDDYIRTALRVPPDLHARLHAAAERAGRTFNAEIITRLNETFVDADIGDALLLKGVDPDSGRLLGYVESPKSEVALTRWLAYRVWLRDMESSLLEVRAEPYSQESEQKERDLADEIVVANKMISDIESSADFPPALRTKPIKSKKKPA
jgi:hypothetical protein